MDHQLSASVLTAPARPDGRRTGTGHPDEFATTSTGPALQQFPLRASSPPEVPSTYLAPADDFPTALAELGLTELHVLHSRVARQLDLEYRTDPAGPHPVTLDRAEELADELDTRQEFLEPAPPEIEGSPTRPVARATVTTPTEAPETLPTNPAAGPVGAAPTGRPAAAPPRRDERLEQLFRRQDRILAAVDLRVGDLGRLRPGDEIEVWHHEVLQCLGVVEETAPELSVLWLREAVDGYRRMVHTRDTVLRYRLRHEPR